MQRFETVEVSVTSTFRDALSPHVLHVTEMAAGGCPGGPTEPDAD